MWVIMLTLIFGHRGASGTHPENTMPAFFEAARVHADGIELDVQLTKDGEVVIIHDEKVDRTTDGKGYVKNFTLAELKKLNAGSRFQDGKYFAEIPSLEEFLHWFKDTNLVCNIEIKSYDATYFHLEKRTLEMVKSYQLEDRIIFSSFNHYSIVYLHQMAPEIETAPLFMEGIYMPWVYAKSIKAKAIHPYYKAAPDKLVVESQKNGIAVRPFTVNHPKELERFFRVKTAAVITDYPKDARALREEMKL